jgi:hypothetical protein
MSYRYCIKSYNPTTEHTLYLPGEYHLASAAIADAALLGEMFPHLVYTVEELT